MSHSEESAACFFTASSRGSNDAANKQREALLVAMTTEAHPEWSQWTCVRSAWLSALSTICGAPADQICVSQKGGRGANYDFLVTAPGREPVKVEFKHNAATIKALPQFLSLAADALPFAVSYAAFYYDGYLRNYIALDPALQAVAIPTREEYLRLVNTPNYAAHPLFQAMYDHEETAKKAKAAVVNASIRAYLEAYGSTLEIAALTAHLQTRQKDKVFLLWDRKTFHIERLTPEDLTIVSIDSDLRRGNTLIARAATRTYKLLLRWKNHKGVLYPAWQIAGADASNHRAL